MFLSRCIGSYQGSEKGALLLVFGAMHGNEPAGVLAMEMLLKMLENEPKHNPHFTFKGKIVGLRGHLRAIAAGKRFIHRDLNRQWKTEKIQQIKNTDDAFLDEEDLEIKEIITFIEQEISVYQPSEIYILDIHTTSAQGGIFTIPADNALSLYIAKQLHAPVVLDLLKGIEGTTLHYFNVENWGKKTAAVCFKAGQHEDPLSVSRAVAAIIFMLQAIGNIKASDIEKKHTEILENYAKNLPSVTTFFHRHKIKPDDDFEMKKGYQNFNFVKKGERLAKDKSGDILAPEDAFLLMPLYQKQGEDGFFLVR